MQTIGELVSRLSEFTEQIFQTIHKNFSAVLETIRKEVLPALKQYAEKIVALGVKITEKLTDIVFLTLAKISEFLDAHQAEFKKLATSVTVVTQGNFYLLPETHFHQLTPKQFAQISADS